MSKTKLKKELNSFDREQLIEIILSAYAAGKETKEYFDYFIDPRPQELYEKYAEQIAKELNRTRYGYRSKARISKIKGFLKKFRSFQPGDTEIQDLYIYTVHSCLLAESCFSFQPTFMNGVMKFVEELLKISDKSGYLPKIIERLQTEIIEDDRCTGKYRREVSATVRNFLDQANINRFK